MTRASFAPHPHPESNFTCVPMADRRVSFAEQQDYLPPVGAPSFWMLAALVASPLLTILVVSMVALLSR